jgi:uncharacterized protein (DUF427 family)
MAVRVRDTFLRGATDLRFEPTEKRIRARLGDETIVDTQRALLVWEPRRAVPYYAVPVEDLRATLEPTAAGERPRSAMPAGGAGPGLGATRDERFAPADTEAPGPTLTVGPFAAHTSPGTAYDVRTGGGVRPAAAYRIDDGDLAGYALLDFVVFGWLEEDEPVVGHPRDPYHRCDVRRSSRRVRIEAGGEVLAESDRPRLMFETNLPVRFYLPREDVRVGRLAPSPTRTYCPYKGQASYLSVDGGDESLRDIAWTYREPLPDSMEIAGMVAFFDERVDVTVDGHKRERPARRF